MIVFFNVPPNKSMKPTAPWRYKFGVFATAPYRGLSPSGLRDC